MHCLCLSPDPRFYSVLSLARAGCQLPAPCFKQVLSMGVGVKKPQHHPSWKTGLANHLQSQQLIIAGGFAKLSRDHNFLLPLICCIDRDHFQTLVISSCFPSFSLPLFALCWLHICQGLSAAPARGSALQLPGAIAGLCLGAADSSSP